VSLSKIRLELARTREHPTGDAGHGFELVAPLDREGRLDVEAWQRVKGKCSVRGFAPGEDDEHGQLIRTRSRNWALSYAPGEEDDEPIYRLADHRFVEGEYVSITEHDGKTLPFKVVSVRTHVPGDEEA
jgi:hypothetical protein